MKIESWGTTKKWLDEDEDYKSYKSILLPKIDYKPYTIDYQDILGKKNKNDDCYSTAKIFANANKFMNEWQNAFVTQYMSQPYSSSPANPNSVVNTTTESNVFTEYPITNHAWTEYHEGDFTTIIPLPVSLTQSQKALELIDTAHKVGTKVYTGRSRLCRHSEGHMMDPWDRSINTFRKHFKVSLLSRQQTKMGENSCEELLVWAIDTTIKGSKVLLIVWESVSMSYLRKSTINTFLERLSPYELKQDQIYSV